MGVKEDIVTLLTGANGFTDSSVTKDDASTEASYDVAVGNPPSMKVSEWFTKNGKDFNALVTVTDLRAENKRITGTVPLVEDGRYLVKTWTVAKTGVDGIKLKQKLDNELKRIFRASPTNRYVVTWEANNRLVNGTWIYGTIFTIAYMVQIIA